MRGAVHRSNGGLRHRRSAPAASTERIGRPIGMRCGRGTSMHWRAAPFVRHWRTPLQALTEQCFAQNHFQPNYLPVTGGIQMVTKLCMGGQAAMTTFVGQTVNEPTMPPAYLLPMRPRDIPAGSYLLSKRRCACRCGPELFGHHPPLFSAHHRLGNPGEVRSYITLPPFRIQ